MFVWSLQVHGLWSCVCLVIAGSWPVVLCLFGHCRFMADHASSATHARRTGPISVSVPLLPTVDHSLVCAVRTRRMTTCVGHREGKCTPPPLNSFTPSLVVWRSLLTHVYKKEKKENKTLEQYCYMAMR